MFETVTATQAKDKIQNLIVETPVGSFPPKFFSNPAVLQKLAGDPEGAFSRRINIPHCLISQIIKDKKVVRVLPLRTHYE